MMAEEFEENAAEAERKFQRTRSYLNSEFDCNIDLEWKVSRRHSGYQLQGKLIDRSYVPPLRIWTSAPMQPAAMFAEAARRMYDYLEVEI